MSESKKSRNNKSILHYLWIYAKTMLGVGEESTIARNIFYILWLFLLLPSIEIVKNELFTKMVYRRLINVDTIDDLLDERVIPLTDHDKLVDWKDFAHRHLKNNTFKEKFEKFLAKAKELGEISKFRNKLEDPIAIRKVMDGLVLVEDESWMDYIIPILSRFTSTHVADNSYLPVYYTPLCFGPQFKFTKKAEVM